MNSSKEEKDLGNLIYGCHGNTVVRVTSKLTNPTQIIPLVSNET